MNTNKLKELFIDIYNRNDGIYNFFAPGRVNLIGEHTDYNGGHVFPCALSFGTYAIAAKRKDNKIRLFSKNFENRGIYEVDINNLVYKKEDDWTNYPKGVVKVFVDAGYKIDKGFDILFYGDIPNGAGLSSSASVELVTSTVLKKLYDLDINMVEMAKLSQRAENQFVGVNCGIMDQFACGMGKKDHAILLDTNTLKYKYAPIILNDIDIVIANTNKRRGLADSKYNERRSECERALKALKEKLNINSLGDLNEKEFEENKYLIKDENEKRRAKHAVYENRRTIKAARYLENQDIEEFGRLMNESHISLRDDYEVTGIELDTLVEVAWKYGAIGSRMTGAGFGGCTVSLVNRENLNEFIEKVGKEYKNKIGYDATFYTVSVGDGAREI